MKINQEMGFSNPFKKSFANEHEAPRAIDENPTFYKKKFLDELLQKNANSLKLWKSDNFSSENMKQKYNAPKDPLSEKPHVILIVADDLGFNDVPWHNSEIIAPYMKSLAEGGVILEQSYVHSSGYPSRAALMTGKYPFTLGASSQYLDDLTPDGLSLSAKLLPEMLKPLGYSTHLIGRWGLGYCKWEYTPTYRGFDSFHGYYIRKQDYFSHARHGTNSFGYDFRHNKNIYMNASGTYSAYEFASYTEKLLHSSNPKDPKFIYLSFQSVHNPMIVPSNYKKLYPNIEDKKRQTLCAMVSAMDEAIGWVIKSLKTTGHYDNSIIIFTTDNGASTVTSGSNFPLKGSKLELFEGGTRGAAFIHSPLIEKPGRISENLIHVTDWLPTILHVAGGEQPPDIDGINQWEAFKTGSVSVRSEMVYDIIELDIKKPQLSTAIRYKDHKLLISSAKPIWGQKEVIKGKAVSSFSGLNSMSDLVDSSLFVYLYNIREDPRERKNMFSRKSPSDVSIDLLNRLFNYKNKVLRKKRLKESSAGEPKNFNDTFSPGWC